MVKIVWLVTMAGMRILCMRQIWDIRLRTTCCIKDSIEVITLLPHMELRAGVIALPSLRIVMGYNRG